MTLQKTLLALIAVLSSTAMLNAQDIGDRINVLVSRGDANSDGKLDVEDLKLMTEILDGNIEATVSTRDLDFNSDGVFDKNDPTDQRRESRQRTTRDHRGSSAAERARRQSPKISSHASGIEPGGKP